MRGKKGTSWSRIRNIAFSFFAASIVLIPGKAKNKKKVVTHEFESYVANL